MRDDEFQQSRESLAAKRKKLKADGKGNLPRKSSAITEDDEKKLVDCGQLGTSTPDAIINTVWYNMTKLFGLRGSNEHHQMTWGDVVVKEDQRGEYLEYNERITKTRKGEPGNTRKFPPKAYATPGHPEICPVRVFKEYDSRRPQKMKLPTSPFYLGIQTATSILQRGVWFRAQPMGRNKIDTIMKRMSSAAGLQGNLTNHSARKASITRLLHAGVPPNTVAQLSGHKNTNSLNRYAIASDDQQKQMSDILTGNRCRYNDRAVLPVDDNPLSCRDNTTPVLSSTQQANSAVAGMFANATITGGTFNFHFNVAGSTSTANCAENQHRAIETPFKRRRPMVLYDSDDE